MDAISLAAELSWKLYEVVEKHSKNKEKRLKIAGEIIDEIQSLENLRKNYAGDSPEADQAILQIQSELEDLLYDCERMYEEPIDPSFRKKIGYYWKKATSASDVEEQLKDIKDQISRAKMNFLMTMSIVSINVKSSNVSSVASPNCVQEAAVLERSLAMQVPEEEEVDSTEEFDSFNASRRYREERQRAYKESDSEPESNEGEIVNESGADPLSTNTRALLEALENSSELFDVEELDVSQPARRGGVGGKHYRRKRFVTKETALREVVKLLQEIQNPGFDARVWEWLDTAIGLAKALDSQFGMLSEALHLFEISTELARKISAQQAGVFDPLLASCLHNHSVALGKGGKKEEALEMCQEACDIYRDLVEQHPASFKPDLLSALRTLSAKLLGRNRLDEALEVSEEAVDIARELAKRNIDKFGSQLVTVLGEYASISHKAGRVEEVLDARYEAVSTLETLAVADPEHYNPRLVQTLIRLCDTLGNNKRYLDAFKVLQQVVNVSEEISEEDLAKYTPEMTRLLKKVSADLAAHGDMDEAFEARRQAAALQGRTKDLDADACDSAWADSLEDLATDLSSRGQRDEAIETMQRCLEVREDLSEKLPAKYLPHLLLAISRHSDILWECGERDEAVEEAERVARIAEGLPKDDGEAFSVSVHARTLVSLSDRLAGLGKLKQSVDTIKRAVDIMEGLVDNDPEYTPELAKALNKLTSKLSRASRHKEAIEPAHRAVEIWRQLADEKPVKYEVDLAFSCNILAEKLMRNDDHYGALDAVEESLEIWKKVDKEKPQKGNMAKSLQTYSNILDSIDRRKESQEVLKEAVDLYRQVVAKRPKLYKPPLASCLCTLARRLGRNRRQEAEELVIEAIELYEGLAKQDPKEYEKRLADAEHLLSLVQGKKSRPNRR